MWYIKWNGETYIVEFVDICESDYRAMEQGYVAVFRTQRRAEYTKDVLRKELAEHIRMGDACRAGDCQPG